MCVGITVVEGEAEEESKEEETRWVTPERLIVIISGSWFFRSGCRALRRAIGMIKKKKARVLSRLPYSLHRAHELQKVRLRAFCN